MKFLIKVNDFYKKYKVEEVRVDKLLITKRITILQGKNGCGKSTILKALAGLISFKGIVEQTGKVSYMSEFPSFPVDLSVNDFINGLNKISIPEICEKEINNLYSLFNLLDKTELLLSSLSKGMKAKVNLVQSLMCKADIYLLDEPLSGLDQEGVRCLMSYLKNSKNNYVISTHLLEDFDNIYDEVIRI